MGRLTRRQYAHRMRPPQRKSMLGDVFRKGTSNREFRPFVITILALAIAGALASRYLGVEIGQIAVAIGAVGAVFFALYLRRTSREAREETARKRAALFQALESERSDESEET